MYVMTVDQHNSRRTPDAVPALLAELNTHFSERLVRAFERTVGDEVQALLDAPDAVVDLVADLVRRGGWSVGVGIGPVEQPVPDSVRAGRGAAFVNARTGVERAKAAPHHLRVVGPDAAAGHAESALWLLAGLLARRTDAGWEAVDSMARHGRQVEAAASLGITPQAMSRRLAVAGWAEDQRGRELAAHLLQEAE